MFVKLENYYLGTASQKMRIISLGLSTNFTNTIGDNFLDKYLFENYHLLAFAHILVFISEIAHFFLWFLKVFV